MTRCAAMLLVVATATAASAQATQQFVHGSWVNLRAAPGSSAPVVGQLVINTPVILRGAPGAAFCEVDDGKGLRGFIACKLLGDKPLTLADVEPPQLADGNIDPQYSPTRAFWLAPSVDRLVNAGRYFEVAMKTAENQQSHASHEGELSKRPALRRFPIPEFEAMKALLAQGVPGAPGTRPAPPAPWSMLQELAAKNPAGEINAAIETPVRTLHAYWGWRDQPYELMRALKLAPVAPSWFKHAAEIGKPDATTEQLSAQFGIPFRAIVTSGPFWSPPSHHNGSYLFGAWDAGTIRADLTRPLQKHVLHASGKLASSADTGTGGHFLTDDDDCAIGYRHGEAAQLVWKAMGNKPRGGDRLFHFYSAGALPHGAAKVTRTRVKYTPAPQEQVMDKFVSAMHTRFDLDHDGVADLLLWEGTGMSNQDIHDLGKNVPHYRLAFVNAGGAWHLLMADEFLFGCGC